MSGKDEKDLIQDRADTPRVPQRIHWPLQAMPLARAIAIIYVFLIGYGCLNPFNVDWKFGLDPFAWWTGPLPKYITLFDVTINILGYIPLGFILVFALYPRWHPRPVAWRVVVVVAERCAAPADRLRRGRQPPGTGAGAGQPGNQ